MRVWQKTTEQSQKALLAPAIVYQRALKNKLSTPGRGVLWSGSKYRSSAPGMPPTVQTGTLRRSIQIDAASRKDRVRVGTNLKYARMLEYGTAMMAARPFVRPVIVDKQVRKSALDAYTKAYKRLFKKIR